MNILKQAALRSLKGCARWSGAKPIAAAAAIAGALAAPQADAAGSAGKAAAKQSYVVGNDRGGYLLDRLRELSRLRESGQRVEIRGRVCFSTCTMLLDLPNSCVSPATTFGFHGPSRSGQRLEPEEFDRFSQVIADHYPAPLRKWYMETGRNRILRIYRVKGSEIIKMGVEAC